MQPNPLRPPDVGRAGGLSSRRPGQVWQTTETAMPTSSSDGVGQVRDTREGPSALLVDGDGTGLVQVVASALERADRPLGVGCAPPPAHHLPGERTATCSRPCWCTWSRTAAGAPRRCGEGTHRRHSRHLVPRAGRKRSPSGRPAPLRLAGADLKILGHRGDRIVARAGASTPPRTHYFASDARR
jgi:hypothetical protein